MLGDFQKHIKSKLSFLKHKKLLIAISGGIDSVVLTHLLNRSNFDLELAHCNFRLRGKDSDEDEQFVVSLAKKLGLNIHTKSFDTEVFAKGNKLSIQMAARQLRYDWFQELLQENALDYLVTAHNLDDNLETFLINFTRGTGLEGLTGMPEIKENIVRPLLAFSREQIAAFAQKNNIVWREDTSNIETKYTRNKIRHQVIPVLKEINPSLLESYKQTAEHFQQSQQIINDSIIELKKQIVIPAQAGIQKIAIQLIRKLSNPKAYLYEILKEYGFTEWDDVANLLETQSGKQVISETHRLIKDREFLLLEPLCADADTSLYVIKRGQKKLKTNEFSIRLSETKDLDLTIQNEKKIFVDGDKLEFPLTLRKWQEGDYFYPFGMAGKKKLSKFFKDEKYSLVDKENTWLLCSGGRILWVVGKRMDNRFKVEGNTKKIVQIEYSK